MDSRLPGNYWPHRPMPWDDIVVCTFPAVKRMSPEAAITFIACFYEKGKTSRRCNAVVADLRRLLDEVDERDGVRRNPRNRDIARSWLDRVVVEVESPLRVRPRWMDRA